MKELIKILKNFQQEEINSYVIYGRIASKIKDEKNSSIFKKIAEDELNHYNLFKKFTGKELKPQKIKIFFYFLLNKIFGFTFLFKFMEIGEEKAHREYLKIKDALPEIKKVILDETEHEKKLSFLLDEDRIKYISSMVLGLNDALVELTGALAGFTFALQNSKVTGIAGLITGISASFSMAASAYLSEKHEEDKDPKKAAIYTGIMYILVVILLIFPYFLFNSFYFAFLFTLFNVILIVALFTYYVSVVQDKKFLNVFLEMLILCILVSVLSFLIGLFARKVFNISID